LTVGRRALPAIALSHGVELLVESPDIVIGFAAERDPETAAALAFARKHGCLTIAFESVGAEWEFVPPTADAFVRQELIQTLCHVVWELVGDFFERHPDVKAVLDDARRSILMKSEEVGELRQRTLAENAAEIEAAAAALREIFDAGGLLLVLGSGGSAADAMDVVADFRAAPQEWPARRAIDLTADAGILTAIAGDIGPYAIFARQVIAYGRKGDALVAISTHDARSVTFALEEARRRGLHTIAVAGNGGGERALEGLADHLVIARSESVLRVQEAQASVCHVLRELVEWAGADRTEGG
jgi:D-sedoheptulose 7-phosphate isomerase